MNNRRVLVYVLLFLLLAISYIDRAALSVAASPIAREFQVSPVKMGYLFSSFLWTYLCASSRQGCWSTGSGRGLRRPVESRSGRSRPWGRCCPTHSVSC